MSRTAYALFLLLACLRLAPAHAGSFTVSPVRLELEPGAAATSLKVINQGDDAKLLQVTALRWTREGGTDHYDVATTDLPIVTPPLFRLGAGGTSQVVRVGFRRPPAPAATERAWRIIVEEVPDASPGKADGTQVAIRLRISLPLFVPPAKPRQDLRWEGTLDASGTLHLLAINAGNVSERLDRLQVASGAGAAAELNGPTYIFPGERRNLELKAAGQLKPGQLKLLMQGTPRPLTSDLVLRAQ